MNRFFSFFVVLICVFALIACGGDKKSHDYEEKVSKKIKAEEGGTVESSDGKTSVDIPAGALDENTTITMTIYDAEGYAGTEGKKVVSKIVEFEPSGTIFKKPVIITMKADEEIKGKTITAAVYDETKKEWSYSRGFYVTLGNGKTEAGDPIMHTTDGKEIAVSDGNLTTAAGDPIMMTNAAGDPIMTNAAGDPIMMSAAGDPIMLASENAAGDPIMTSAAGDPIMTSAAGDPIMNAAAGDPIMMTTGHFTAYTFIAFDPREGGEEEPDEPAEEDDDEPIDDSDTTEPDNDDIDDNDDNDDSDTTEPDEDEPVDDDIIPEPDPVYSKVLCTGSSRCIDEGSEAFIDCPKEGEAMNGQDAQYAAKKSCVTAKYTKIPKTFEEGYDQVVDEVTGIRWIVGISGTKAWEEANNFCADLDSGGYEDWRLPTPKEAMSIAVGDSYGHAVREFYFNDFDVSSNYIWVAQEVAEGEQSAWVFGINDGLLEQVEDPVDQYNYVMCVRGDEYGKVAAENYTSETVNGEEMIRDSSTDLFWQKTVTTGISSIKDALAYCENLEYAGKSDWRLPNKNEFLTLIDYSKSNPASSFPAEMPEEVFITSTPVIGYYNPEDVWGWNMATGERGYLYEGFSVRCVRSDVKGYPEGMDMPYCDETGVAPCKDEVTGYVWSPASTKYLPAGGYADR